MSRDVVFDEASSWNWNEPQPPLSSPSQHDQTSASDAQLEIQEDESIDDLPVRGTKSLEDIYQNSLVTIEKPSCYTEACKDPVWFKAMQ